MRPEIQQYVITRETLGLAYLVILLAKLKVLNLGYRVERAEEMVRMLVSESGIDRVYL